MIDDTIEVRDNVLNTQDYSDLVALISKSRNFKWSRSRCLPDGNFADEVKYNLQFTHMFYSNGSHGSSESTVCEFYSFIMPLLQIMDIDVLIKVKANLTVNRGKQYSQGMHVDVPKNLQARGKTAIYYLNETDGGTLFENGEFVTGNKNRLVIFRNNINHSAVTHTSDSPDRVVINFNWIYQRYFPLEHEGVTVTMAS
jgi:hypothetical protein